jgi:hypothetical protein
MPAKKNGKAPSTKQQLRTVGKELKIADKMIAKGTASKARLEEKQKKLQARLAKTEPAQSTT